MGTTSEDTEEFVEEYMKPKGFIGSPSPTVGHMV